ncbi:ASCH domain-containing protein [Pedobacter agri]|uniref:ASCH domain-containing protein n=1 Tax=Pedobacter agri TaxID=454586 RepID=UPI0027879B44|nr:ASCH domain-containing protein [Pedobacter agri]MDQ1139439.1 hypothetical protein [Pedobacter agri]
MKALSIKQPWASLIASGIKDIENRTWATKYRGRIYIHASGKPAGIELQTILNYEQAKAIPESKWYDMCVGIWPLSCIIGEVDIIDCVLGHTSIWAEHSAIVTRKGIEIEVPVYNWVLANPVLYEHPILNVKGALSLWEYEKPYEFVGSAEMVNVGGDSQKLNTSGL